jgi:hypothetical protein
MLMKDQSGMTQISCREHTVSHRTTGLAAISGRMLLLMVCALESNRMLLAPLTSLGCPTYVWSDPLWVETFVIWLETEFHFGWNGGGMNRPEEQPLLDQLLYPDECWLSVSEGEAGEPRMCARRQHPVPTLLLLSPSLHRRVGRCEHAGRDAWLGGRVRRGGAGVLGRVG